MTPQQNRNAPDAAASQQPGYTVERYGASRYWQVRDAAGELVCLTVYKRGAVEVVRRLRG